MGIMSSTESNSRNVRCPWGRFPWGGFPWEKLGSADIREPLLEKERDASAEAAVDFFIKEVDAFLPPKLGESSTNKPKEEWEEEVLMRFNKFMKGGGCKESYTAIEDCVEETQSIIPECKQHLPMLFKCMDAHSRYYQPIIAVAESTVEQMTKDVEELAERIQAERKQARGNKLRGNKLRGDSDHLG